MERSSEQDLERLMQDIQPDSEDSKKNIEELSYEAQSVDVEERFMV